MSKKLFVCKNTGESTPWIDFTFNDIKKFIEFEKDNFEVIDELVFDENDDVYLVGYKTSEIVQKVIKMRANGINVNLIENLCCDDSVRAHRKACDEMFLNSIKKNRNFRFVKDELIEVFKNAVYKNRGEDVMIDEEKYTFSYSLDSLDMVELIDEIEDRFNVEITKIALTKPCKISNLNKILEGGYISDKFNK